MTTTLIIVGSVFSYILIAVALHSLVYVMEQRDRAIRRAEAKARGAYYSTAYRDWLAWHMLAWLWPLWAIAGPLYLVVAFFCMVGKHLRGYLDTKVNA